MGGGVFRIFRLGLVTLYALATLVAVLVAPAHMAQVHGGSVMDGAAICAAQQGKAGKTEFSSLCCDSCNLAASAGLEPPPVATLLLRHEIRTRLTFAQRLGLTADARPDDLRSRAPPAA